MQVAVLGWAAKLWVVPQVVWTDLALQQGGPTPPQSNTPCAPGIGVKAVLLKNPVPG